MGFCAPTVFDGAAVKMLRSVQLLCTAPKNQRSSSGLQVSV
jgi:hypothetical protein